MSSQHSLFSVVITILAMFSLVLCEPATLPELKSIAKASNVQEYGISTSKPDVQSEIYNLKSCIVLQMGAYFKTATGEYISYSNGTVSETGSDCGAKSDNEGPYMRINFENGYLIFDVNLNENGSTYVDRILGEYKDSEGKFKTYISPAFATYFNTTKPNHYYRCNAEQNITMTSEGSLFLSNFGLEVFRNSTSLEFYQDSEVCALDKELTLLSIVLIVVAILMGVVGLSFVIGQCKNSGEY